MSSTIDLDDVEARATAAVRAELRRQLRIPPAPIPVIATRANSESALSRVRQ
jgi:hypothetical protein